MRLCNEILEDEGFGTRTMSRFERVSGVEYAKKTTLFG
jgi:hypothetical protein